MSDFNRFYVINKDGEYWDGGILNIRHRNQPHSVTMRQCLYAIKFVHIYQYGFKIYDRNMVEIDMDFLKKLADVMSPNYHALTSPEMCDSAWNIIKTIKDSNDDDWYIVTEQHHTDNSAVNDIDQHLIETMETNGFRVIYGKVFNAIQSKEAVAFYRLYREFKTAESFDGWFEITV